MSYNTGPKIVTNGLVLCLDAASNKSYPGTGTSWNDLSGNNNNGTLTNGPTFSSTNKGSIVFDGSDDNVIVSNISNFNQTSGITVSAMIYATAKMGSYDTFISKYTNVDSGTNGLKWILRMENYKVSWYTNTGSFSNVVSNTTLSLNQWYYLTGVFNGTQRIIYINGVLDNSNSTTGTLIDNSLTPVRLGSSGIGEYFKGNITSFTIYNRGLSPSEVRENYNAIKERFIS
jgi:hypothetical protein